MQAFSCMLRYGMNIDHLVVIVKLGSVQADAVNFAFAYLVIIRISRSPCLTGLRGAWNSVFATIRKGSRLQK